MAYLISIRAASIFPRPRPSGLLGNNEGNRRLLEWTRVVRASLLARFMALCFRLRKEAHFAQRPCPLRLSGNRKSYVTAARVYSRSPPNSAVPNWVRALESWGPGDRDPLDPFSFFGCVSSHQMISAFDYRLLRSPESSGFQGPLGPWQVQGSALALPYLASHGAAPPALISNSARAGYDFSNRRPEPVMPALGHALLDALRAHGAREIFGIPGDFVLPFFKVIEESGILPFYTLSHEPAVGFAADAAARFHGAISVAVVDLGRGRVQSGEPDRRRLCRALAGGGDLRRARRARSGAERLAAPPHVARDRHPVAHLPRDHLRPGGAGRPRRARPPRSPACCAARSNYSLPVYIELPRDLVGAEIGAVDRAAAPAGRSGRARRMRRRDHRRGCARPSGR